MTHPSANLLDQVPLVANPALTLQQKITLPPDIHPLPPDVSAYFVYPFALETHVMSPPSPHLSHASQLEMSQSQHQKRLDVLQERIQEKKRREQEHLRKLAPGWEQGNVLEPVKQQSRSQPQSQYQSQTSSPS